MSERAGRGPDTWMPLYIGDYLADTLHLSAEQHGAYLLMLMAAWRKGGALPDDDAQLASIAKLDAAKWRKSRPVLAAFFNTEDGQWRQKRLDAELSAAITLQQQKSAAGKAGADARYKRNGASANSETVADAVADASFRQSRSHAPSPSPLKHPHTPSADAEHCGANGHDFLRERDAAESLIPHQEVIDAYHEILPMCPRVAKWSKKRRGLLKARWNEDAERQNVEWWRNFFGWVAESKFLTGRVPSREPDRPPFLADIEWLLTESHFLKVIEGGFNRSAQQ